jgi:UV DNA damage endonuclease
MKIGYPCINLSIGCISSKTFRLASYSKERLIQTVGQNLACLQRTLEYNVSHGLYFFRITSDLIPFASHPICKYNWQKHFEVEFKSIGMFIKKHGIRISMHPDQFTLINSPDRNILSRSARELVYHSNVLGAMDLDTTAKIQIHVGGVYDDKSASMKRFIKRYKELAHEVKGRLVIENDEKLYSLGDCLAIHQETGAPILFDSYHHSILNNKEPLARACALAGKTWQKGDGTPMVDYSSQKGGGRIGAHAESIDIADFKRFLRQTLGCDFDVMLEVKDKEKSALLALKAASKDPRFLSSEK